jgi:transposase
MVVMGRRITATAGVTQVVKVRLEPTAAQVALLASWGSRGTSSGWRNCSAEIATSGCRGGPGVPWQVLDLPAQQLAVGLARFKAGQGRFPTFKKKHGPAAGLVPVTFRDASVAWLGEGGRSLNLPISVSHRREAGTGAAVNLSHLRVVKDNRCRKAAKLIRDGHGQVQTVTYSLSGGYWWAAIGLPVLPAHATRSNRRRPDTSVPVIGVDAGMGRLFATLSTPIAGVTDDAGHIEAPKHLRRALADLADAQRWSQHTTKGSRRHRKALARVQKVHGRVADRRATFHHQLAIALTEHAPLVGVETLNLRGMARRKIGFRFGLSVSDAGYGTFVDILTRQATKRGVTVIAASPWFPSSKTCSGCGAAKTKLPLSQREYSCTTCGLVIDRDVNAAINLADYAVLHQHDGVNDAGEASSAQTPPPRGAAAFETGQSGLVKRRVPDSTCAAA